MVGSSITILCYWHGKMATGLHGLTYEGANPKAIKVNYQVTYSELMDKIYSITGYSKQQVQIKIICRYPSSCMEYIPLPIEDQDTLNIILDVAKRPGIHCLELYLELKSYSIQRQVQQDFSTEPFSQLPIEEDTQVEDFRTNCDVLVGDKHQRLAIEDVLSLDSRIKRSNIGEQHSTEAVNEHVQHFVDDDPPEVNYTSTIEEIVMSEACNLLLDGADINNNLLNSDDEREYEESEPTDMLNEEAPVPDFTNIECVNKAIISSS